MYDKQLKKEFEKDLNKTMKKYEKVLTKDTYTRKEVLEFIRLILKGAGKAVLEENQNFSNS